MVQPESSVNNSPIQYCVYPDDHSQLPYEMAPGFKPSQFYIIFCSLRSAGVFPVVASLPPKNRERSDDRKYVCASYIFSYEQNKGVRMCVHKHD